MTKQEMQRSIGKVCEAAIFAEEPAHVMDMYKRIEAVTEKYARELAISELQKLENKFFDSDIPGTTFAMAEVGKAITKLTEGNGQEKE